MHQTKVIEFRKIYLMNSYQFDLEWYQTQIKVTSIF